MCFSTRRRLGVLLAAASLLLSATPTARAQDAPPTRPTTPCGTDAAMREVLGAGYDAWMHDYTTRLVPALSAPTASRAPGSTPVGPRFIVPIVIHIIHTNGNNNISEAQVYDAIRVLNEDYQTRNADTANVIPYFRPRIGNTNFEFRLARRDPNGNCTNGITRTYSTLTNSAGENVKGLVTWDPARYLNVWVVSTIASGAAGYSYLPCGVGRSMEGIVILNNYFGSIGLSSPGYAAHALGHEVGHYMGLPHTWGGSNTPGLASNCSTDDGIADTPNTTGSTSCNLQQRACAGSPDTYANTQNFMDYAGCPHMYTTGQATLMNRGVSPGGYSCRQQLVAAATLQSTGVADGLNLPACPPTASIRTSTAGPDGVVRLCAGGAVAFRGEAFGHQPNAGTLTYAWSFPGGQPATSANPVLNVTYPTPGIYDVTLTVTDANGTDSTTQARLVAVGSVTGGYTAPLTFGFEPTRFPEVTGDSLKTWAFSRDATASAGSASWEPTTVASSDNDGGAARIRLRSATARSNHYLVSPNLNVTPALTPNRVYFKRAYTPATASASDVLVVSTSIDCGRTWVPRLTRNAAALRTSPSVAGIYVPLPTQWVQDSVPLVSSVLSAGHVLLRFAVTANGGNALYIDEIRVGRPAAPNGLLAGTDASALTLMVIPNPVDGADMAAAAVRVSAATAGPLTVRVLDVTGRAVGQPWTTAPTLANSERTVPLRTLLGTRPAAGLYLLELRDSTGQRRTQRLVIN